MRLPVVIANRMALYSGQRGIEHRVGTLMCMELELIVLKGGAEVSILTAYKRQVIDLNLTIPTGRAD